ncbi:uncharacterized protein LOC123371158 [Mauremys mutica]|uniref:uncharacterized protein LOC123371158 n=1 Tax=Mauremys mutica TaxID=74926 RepID=UPI001D16F025|nr:uncharacterized protein LOC123371158 [Mauremys mutica]
MSIWQQYNHVDAAGQCTRMSLLDPRCAQPGSLTPERSGASRQPAALPCAPQAGRSSPAKGARLYCVLGICPRDVRKAPRDVTGPLSFPRGGRDGGGLVRGAEKAASQRPPPAAQPHCVGLRGAEAADAMGEKKGSWKQCFCCAGPPQTKSSISINLNNVEPEEPAEEAEEIKQQIAEDSFCADVQVQTSYVEIPPGNRWRWSRLQTEAQVQTSNLELPDEETFLPFESEVQVQTSDLEILEEETSLLSYGEFIPHRK